LSNMPKLMFRPPISARFAAQPGCAGNQN